MTEMKALRINSERMLVAFNQLALVGATGNDGVNRPALSEAHLAARKWFREEIEKSGLEFHLDGAGNNSAFLACGPKEASTLLPGSHLDSVPNGRRFDGALGVLAALEVLRTIREADFRLSVNLEAIDFTDEEGTLVGKPGQIIAQRHGAVCRAAVDGAVWISHLKQQSARPDETFKLSPISK